MDEKQINVPYIVHESQMARSERVIKRLWILCIVLFLAFAVSNGMWVVYENSFEDSIQTTIEAQQDGSGTNIISGRDLSYGPESQGY